MENVSDCEDICTEELIWDLLRSQDLDIKTLSYLLHGDLTCQKSSTE